MMSNFFKISLLASSVLVSYPIAAQNQDKQDEDKTSSQTVKKVKTEQDKLLDLLGLLSEEEIRSVLVAARKQVRATQRPVNNPATMTKSEVLRLEPGVKPPLVFVSDNYVSTLTFTDITGERWPIEQVISGDDSSFDVQVLSGEKDHVVFVKPLSLYKPGNLTVLFKDLDMPLVVKLDFSDDRVDVSRHFKISARGALSKTSSSPGQMTQALSKVYDAADPVMMDFMDLTPPSKAVPVSLTGLSHREARAWLYKGHIYLRSKFQVHSPAPLNQNKSIGVTGEEVGVYKLSKDPVILVTKGNETVFVNIQVPNE